MNAVRLEQIEIALDDERNAAHNRRHTMSTISSRFGWLSMKWTSEENAQAYAAGMRESGYTTEVIADGAAFNVNVSAESPVAASSLEQRANRVIATINAPIASELYVQEALGTDTDMVLELVGDMRSSDIVEEISGAFRAGVRFGMLNAEEQGNWLEEARAVVARMEAELDDDADDEPSDEVTE